MILALKVKHPSEKVNMYMSGMEKQVKKTRRVIKQHAK